MAGDAIARLEERLCAYLGRKHCCVTGRGATALYLALKALPHRAGKVIVPAIVCPSVAHVTLYAGFEPIFCDVNLNDYTMDVISLEKMVTSSDEVVAVIPVHLYGQPANMERIIDLARRHRLVVIEDAAQAMGADYRGKTVGSLGDMSVVSFGHTKILDVGWGGAVLTDDDRFAQRLKEAYAELPDCPANIATLSSGYRTVYYALKSLADLDERLNDLFLPLPALYREMYLFRATRACTEEIAVQLDRVGGYVQKRRENAAAYTRRLQHPDILLPTYEHEGAPWRFSFLLRRNIQQSVATQMRSIGIDVSSWYPPLYRWYPSGKAQDRRLFANADFLGTHILNLWVEPSVDHAYIAHVCDALLRIVARTQEPASPLSPIPVERPA